MEENVIIIRRLKEALYLRNMTMSELARKSGIDKGVISRYLNGKAVPKIAAVKQMATVLSISPAWLSGYDTPDAPKALTPAEGLNSIGIDVRKLSKSDIDKLVGYYQCLLDAHK